MIFLNDALYLKKSTFSLISDEKQTETADIRFDEISDITVERNVFMVGTGEKKQHRVRTCFVVICYGNGQKVLLPRLMTPTLTILQARLKRSAEFYNP